jgi:hypothetical protein
MNFHEQLFSYIVFLFVVGNNIVPGKVFNIVDLHPGSQYKLRVTAHNAAGSSVANYRFTTLTAIGGEFNHVKIYPCETYFQP